MRWIFLPFILLLAYVGYASLLREQTPARLLAAVPFYVFVLSLLGFWWFSYFANQARAYRGRVVSHALLMLALGAFVCLAGGHLVATDSCSILISSSQYPGATSRTASFIQSLGYCREAGVLLLIFGAVIAAPSTRLFSALLRNE